MKTKTKAANPEPEEKHNPGKSRGNIKLWISAIAVLAIYIYIFLYRPDIREKIEIDVLRDSFRHLFQWISERLQEIDSGKMAKELLDQLARLIDRVHIP